MYLLIITSIRFFMFIRGLLTSHPSASFSCHKTSGAVQRRGGRAFGMLIIDFGKQTDGQINLN